MSLRRAAGWLTLLALLELCARALVYGLAPSTTARMMSLSGDFGGPAFVTVLLVALGLGAAGSVLLVWLASLGVRERWALADDPPAGVPPRIALRPLVVRAAGLTLAGWLTFAAVESMVHLQAGLGFHGLSCLVGPVHRNALPVIGGLALIASATLAAAGHVLAWMRRTVGRLAAPRAAAVRHLAAAVPVVPRAPRSAPRYAVPAPRGPPSLVA